MTEAAEILTRVTGREVRFVDETLEEARESRRPSGAPDWEIEGWVTTYAAIAAGELGVVPDHGGGPPSAAAGAAGPAASPEEGEGTAAPPPMTLPELLERHPESWEHLKA